MARPSTICVSAHHEFRAIWIKHHSASDGVLFRRIAITNDRQQMQRLAMRVLPERSLFCEFKIAIFTEGDLRCDSRCSMMKITLMTAFQRTRGGIFRDAKPPRFFDKSY